MKLIHLKNGQAVTIKEGSPEDAPELVDYLTKIGGESDFLTFGPGEFSISVEEEELILEESLAAKNKLMLLALKGNKVIGCLHFVGGARARTQHSGELGVTVLKEYWNQGIGTVLVKALIRWAKTSGGIRKLNLRVRSDNSRAVHVYEKLGFIQEGLIARELFISGQFYNFIFMGLCLDPD